MGIRDIGFQTRFLIFLGIFLLGYVLLIVIGDRTLDRVMVNGEIYNRVVGDKDVIADILPPPKFIVESFLYTHRIAAEEDQMTRSMFLDELDDAIKAYEERHAYYLEVPPLDPELRELLMETSHGPAQKFFELVRTQFIPTVEGRTTEFGTPMEIVVGKLEPLFDQHRDAVEAAVTRAEATIAAHEAEAAEAVGSGKRAVLLVAVLVVLVVGAAGLWILHSILSSIRLIVARTREMALADADLSARLEIDSKDEVGQLAHWFNAFLDKIAGLVMAVTRSSVQLTSTATEMAATSREQENTISSFGASTNQIAASVKQISATSHELQDTMHQVNEGARSSAALAAEGGHSLMTMSKTMKELAKSSASISDKLAAISQKAGDITGVVTTITKVADQTNLLSVNAAIEAEKSGEYGRGFLVVAREIRRLADQTGSATLDIETTVQQMQSAVSAGVMEMDKFSEQVRRSVKDAGAVSEKLGQIIDEVEGLTGRFELVNQGMESQTQGAEQISDAMGDLTRSVRQTTDSLSEFTAAAEDMKRSVDGLKGEISMFRLEG